MLCEVRKVAGSATYEIKQNKVCCLIIQFVENLSLLIKILGEIHLLKNVLTSFFIVFQDFCGSWMKSSLHWRVCPRSYHRASVLRSWKTWRIQYPDEHHINSSSYYNHLFINVHLNPAEEQLCVVQPKQRRLWVILWKWDRRHFTLIF